MGGFSRFLISERNSDAVSFAPVCASPVDSQEFPGEVFHRESHFHLRTVHRDWNLDVLEKTDGWSFWAHQSNKNNSCYYNQLSSQFGRELRKSGLRATGNILVSYDV